MTEYVNSPSFASSLTGRAANTWEESTKYPEVATCAGDPTSGALATDAPMPSESHNDRGMAAVPRGDRSTSETFGGPDVSPPPGPRVRFRPHRAAAVAHGHVPARCSAAVIAAEARGHARSLGPNRISQRDPCLVAESSRHASHERRLGAFGRRIAAFDEEAGATA